MKYNDTIFFDQFDLTFEKCWTVIRNDRTHEELYDLIGIGSYSNSVTALDLKK